MLTHAAEEHCEVHDSDGPPSTPVVFIQRVITVQQQENTPEHVLVFYRGSFRGGLYIIHQSLNSESGRVSIFRLEGLN